MNTATNYDKNKLITRALVGERLSGIEAAFCFYLLDQQYGYTKEKGRDGDSSGYGHIAKIIHSSTASVKRAVKSLVRRKIIFREINATRYGNLYKFNENTDEWTRDDTKDSSKNQTTASSKIDTRVVSEVIPNNKVSPVNNHTVNNNNASRLLPRSEIFKIIIQKYFEAYRQAFGKEHPALKEVQIISIISAMADFSDEHCFDEEQVELVFQGMIEGHFTRTDGLHTDYNINHFATSGIMKNLFYRCCY